MKRIPVISSVIRSVGWGEGEVLEVEFNTGKVYRYEGVGADLYEELMAAESVGSFFSRRIRNSFAGTLVNS